MPDFDFVGAAYQAASITQNDQALINWYCEIDQTKQQGERGVIALYPTPGLVEKAQLAVAEVRGLRVVNGGTILLAVSGSNLYSVNMAFNATLVGNLVSTSGQVSITDNGVSAYITDGTNRYFYTWGTGAFGQLIDGAFPTGGVCDEVDNFIVYNRPGTNQWGCTDVGSVDSSALNLGTKIGAQDNILAIVADHRQVILLGEYYSERHINTGAFPFPFTAIPGTSLQHGIQAVNSIARLGEGVAYLARDQRGNATVIMWGSVMPAPVRISTFAIENAIQQYAVTNDAIAYTYSQAGHEFYMLTFPTEDVTWCYDLATNLWHQRAWMDQYSRYRRHRSNCQALFGGLTIVGDFENGKLYSMTQEVYTDNGDTIPCVRRCRHLTTDLRRQYFSDLQIQFQPGVGLQSGQGEDPKFILRWSNDGGFTFGNDHLITIGRAGRYKHRGIKRRMGWGRDRVYEVVVTDPVYRVVVSANINASSAAN